MLLLGSVYPARTNVQMVLENSPTSKVSFYYANLGMMLEKYWGLD